MEEQDEMLIHEDEHKRDISLYKELRLAKLLSHQQELDLAKKARKGSVVARNKLAYHNFKLINTFLNRRLGYIMEWSRFQDIFQELAVGIIYAAERYEGHKYSTFRSYAYWWMKKMLYQAFEDEKRIHVGPGYYRNIRKFAKLTREFYEKDETLLVENAADILHWEVEKVLMTMSDFETEHFVSFEDLVTEDEDGFIEYPVADDLQLIDESFSEVQSAEVLRCRLRHCLPSHHLKMADRLYGVMDEENYIGGIVRVAEALGTGKVNVWRQEQRLLERLRYDPVIFELAGKDPKKEWQPKEKKGPTVYVKKREPGAEAAG